MKTAGSPAAPLRVLHLSDTHLFADPDGSLLKVNTLNSFERTLNLAQQGDWPPDLILATGDLVHDGSELGYQRLFERLNGLGPPVYCLAGNHDDPAKLQSVLSNGNLHVSSHLRSTHWCFIFLDSNQDGETGGHLADAELQRLDRHLRENPDRHVMVCLHHQPVPVGSAWLDGMAVDNADALFRIIERHPQTRCLLWGHVHQAFDEVRDCLRLLSAPSTCIQFKPGSSDFALDSVGPGVRWLELHADGRIETRVERLEDSAVQGDRLATGYR